MVGILFWLPLSLAAASGGNPFQNFPSAWPILSLNSRKHPVKCGQDGRLFCAVMAIASVESGFDAQTVGDGGDSLGMMQINTKWHTGRMEALGVTDLTDPVQCAAVAIDYLRELEARYGFEPESHELCLAYNMGPSGARKALADGITSNNYSESVLSTYQNYLAEIGGRTWSD